MSVTPDCRLAPARIDSSVTQVEINPPWPTLLRSHDSTACDATA
jgi:hypothetical protein